MNLERSSVQVLLEARDGGLRCEHLSALESSEVDVAGEVHRAPHAAARIRVVVVDVEPAARRRLPAERADAALIGEESSVVGQREGLVDAVQLPGLLRGVRSALLGGALARDCRAKARQARLTAASGPRILRCPRVVALHPGRPARGRHLRSLNRVRPAPRGLRASLRALGWISVAALGRRADFRSMLTGERPTAVSIHVSPIQEGE